MNFYIPGRTYSNSRYSDPETWLFSNAYQPTESDRPKVCTN